MKTKDMFSHYKLSQDNNIITNDGKIVKTFKSNNYLQCCLFDNKGKKHTMGLHTAIAMLVLDDWYDGCVVHHKDGDYKNNNPSNLEIMSRKEHATYHYINTPNDKFINTKNFGEKNGGSKLTTKDVLYIKKYYINGSREFGSRAMARKFNVTKTCILDIINGRTWKNI